MVPDAAESSSRQDFPPFIELSCTVQVEFLHSEYVSTENTETEVHSAAERVNFCTFRQPIWNFPTRRTFARVNFLYARRNDADTCSKVARRDPINRRRNNSASLAKSKTGSVHWALGVSGSSLLNVLFPSRLGRDFGARGFKETRKFHSRVQAFRKFFGKHREN